MNQDDNFMYKNSFFVHLTLKDVLTLMLTKPNGEMMSDIHYYGDNAEVTELTQNTPRGVRVTKHPSIVDY